MASRGFRVQLKACHLSSQTVLNRWGKEIGKNWCMHQSVTASSQTWPQVFSLHGPGWNLRPNSPGHLCGRHLHPVCGTHRSHWSFLVLWYVSVWQSFGSQACGALLPGQKGSLFPGQSLDLQRWAGCLLRTSLPNLSSALNIYSFQWRLQKLLKASTVSSAQEPKRSHRSSSCGIHSSIGFPDLVNKMLYAQLNLNFTLKKLNLNFFLLVCICSKYCMRHTYVNVFSHFSIYLNFNFNCVSYVLISLS